MIAAIRAVLAIERIPEPPMAVVRIKSFRRIESLRNGHGRKRVGNRRCGGRKKRSRRKKKKTKEKLGGAVRPFDSTPDLGPFVEKMESRWLHFVLARESEMRAPENEISVEGRIEDLNGVILVLKY
jgi:hypothetical protein